MQKHEVTFSDDVLAVVDDGCLENTANVIGRMGKNKQRAARAARTLE